METTKIKVKLDVDQKQALKTTIKLLDDITYNIGVFDGSVYDSKGHRIMSKDDLQTAAFVLNELTKISFVTKTTI